jgi:hypothetical protein
MLTMKLSTSYNWNSSHCYYYYYLQCYYPLLQAMKMKKTYSSIGNSIIKRHGTLMWSWVRNGEFVYGLRFQGQSAYTTVVWMFRFPHYPVPSPCAFEAEISVRPDSGWSPLLLVLMLSCSCTPISALSTVSTSHYRLWSVSGSSPRPRASDKDFNACITDIATVHKTLNASSYDQRITSHHGTSTRWHICSASCATNRRISGEQVARRMLTNSIPVDPLTETTGVRFQ